MFGSIFSGAGFWDAGSLILMLIFIGGYVRFIRTMGRTDYKKGTPQDEIYYSGNIVPDADVFSVPASSSYWGFRVALKGYYARIVAMHTGVGTDYVGACLIVAAIVLVLALI